MRIDGANPMVCSITVRTAKNMIPIKTNKNNFFRLSPAKPLPTAPPIPSSNVCPKNQPSNNDVSAVEIDSNPRVKDPHTLSSLIKSANSSREYMSYTKPYAFITSFEWLPLQLQ